MNAPLDAPTSPRDAFAALLPDGAWLTGDAAAPYLADVLRYQGTALGVALPETVEQLSALARTAFEQRVTLVPQGERTGLCGAALPDRGGTQCAVSFARMKRVRGYDPVNRSITVEAGLRLSELNRHAEPAGLCLPIDLGSDPAVGGLLGANAGGSRLIKYGDTRRNVLGVEAVLADRDGTVLDLLAPLRKNNTGLDLKQLFIGAGGANGLVSAVSFALAPVERSSHTILIAFASYDAATRGLVAFEAAFGELLSAYEFISARALAHVSAVFPALRAPFDDGAAACFALVEIASGMAGLDALFEARGLDLVQALLGEGAALDAAFGASERFWRIRDSLPLAVAQDALPLSFDIAFARGALAPFLEETARWFAAAHPRLGYYEFGHFGDGGCHLIVAIPLALADQYGPMRQIALRGELYERVRRHGGSFSAEHGIGPTNLAYYRKFVPPATRAAATAIQQALDPRALCGRVRY
ncbi:FAD-binding oxidoreductase [Burkholderia alba]|uniref:FAD-binding oxidoreductase n=1 Tax=Burkholderia alba TaxID=2683677 RepID=UPI002B052ABD|nr:FAD-binding oxidoreductase [Burkholderia alba]